MSERARLFFFSLNLVIFFNGYHNVAFGAESENAPTAESERVAASTGGAQTDSADPLDAAENIAPSPETELFETDGVSLSELTLSKGIEERNPVDSGTRFRLGEFERIYAFLNVKNPEGAADELTVAWAPVDGRERGAVNVKIGAQKTWRTWAFSKIIKKVGKWQVVVRNSAGTLIGRAQFEILEGATE